MASNQACFPLSMGKDGPVLNQITKIRLADGEEVAIVDWSWRPQYSWIDTQSGWTDDELRAFTYSAGQTISTSANVPAAIRETATLKHTNISSPAEMDALEEMLVYAICVELYQATNSSDTSIVFTGAGAPIPLPNNIAILHHSTILELEVSDKAYFQASLGWFPPGFGVSGFGNDDGRVYGQNSHPSREAVDLAPVPVHIGGTEKFAVIVHNPDGTAVTYRTAAGVAANNEMIRMRINLMGLHKRPSG